MEIRNRKFYFPTVQAALASIDLHGIIPDGVEIDPELGTSLFIHIMDESKYGFIVEVFRLENKFYAQPITHEIN